MNQKTESLQIDYYLGLIFRRRWLIIIPFCLALGVGIYLSVTLPSIYEASTLILVEPQRVPTTYVTPTISSDIDSRISTISQQILSRTNLEKIINDFKLFPDNANQNMFMEDKLASLRRQIKVEVTRSRQTSDAFTITFRGSEPQKAMNIANALASHFIDTNLVIREEQATGTSTFLEAELENVRKRLEELDGQLSVFRNKYMGELPEQLDSNLRLLGTLEGQLGNRQERLRDERNRLLLVTNEIEQIQREIQAARRAGGAERSGPSLPQLREQLAGMRTAYTDRHPDVIRLKQRIAEMEAAEASNPSGAAVSEEAVDTRRLPATAPPFLREKIARRTEIEMSIANLQADIGQINQQIREYRMRIERTPKREEELLSLKRDYENVQNTYKSLLNRKMESDIALSMEKKKKGEQFRIVDYARLPEKPVSPDVPRLFAMSSAAGLGVGFGIIFLLDLLNATFRRPEEIESILGIRVLATIPRIHNAREKLMRRLNMGLTAVGLALASALLACFGMLAFKGIQPTMEVARRFITM
jgi:polysaccharide chain length determinant protein (PEP-CTERM system associated)